MSRVISFLVNFVATTLVLNCADKPIILVGVVIVVAIVNFIDGRESNKRY